MIADDVAGVVAVVVLFVEEQSVCRVSPFASTTSTRSLYTESSPADSGQAETASSKRLRSSQTTLFPLFAFRFLRIH
jgi:hypothetical protein